MIIVDGASGAIAAEAANAHAGHIASLVWNPRAQVLASAGSDKSVRIWRENHPLPVADFDGGTEQPSRLAWSPDGQRLAIACGLVVVLCDARGAIQSVTQDHVGAVTGLEWRLCGRRIATACRAGVHVFDAVSARKVQSIAGRADVVGLAASPDGRMLAGGCQDNSLRVWRLDDGAATRRSGYADVPRVLSWRGDSRVLATSGAEPCLLWKFEDGAPSFEPKPIPLETRGVAPVALAFTRGGPWLASACGAGRVCVWDPDRSREPLGAIEASASVSLLAWRGRGSRDAIAVSGRDGTLEVFVVG